MLHIVLLLGELLGFRRPRRSGIPPIVVIGGGILACVMGCPVALFGAPYSWYQARQVAALPAPAPDKLKAMATGTSVLVSAQIPRTASTNRYGQALFYVEERVESQGTIRRTSGPNRRRSSTSWGKIQPPPQKMEMTLLDGSMVTVQMSSNSSFLNAETFEERSFVNQSKEKRYVGYLPGQTLTLRGKWEGKNLLIADTLYGGTRDDYLNYLSYTQPGGMIIMGAFCSLIGLLLLGVGAFMRLTGR